MRLEVRIAGFGGQGIIRAGLIVAMAASLYEDKNAVQTQSYGPESRGGSCRSEVVISDDEIDFPKVTDPDILVVMSQAAYTRYAGTLKSGGTLILDPDMIPQQQTMHDKRIYKVPATKMAEELGKTIIANVIMLGALTSITRIVDAEAMKKAILSNIPKGTEKLNLDAFEKGYEYGKKVLEESNA
ncbi:MAG: 2-oxoacid:ferredoxin oxidoreductase subunit gamma [Candidatus Bathyarchaeia archaeon]|jgi:2-oxoglutarate ferredoxin oxidoreductase subunit gamma|nr:2-oxoacid:ferredoxin oxidoreductase subunit gamma [Candidatus Bathyarchaeota archaeon A05DMB-4]MDH7594888.1 2-oxoacid:ferredoxin oxidoreductase subunit gamma [Candidatus Bathyarchaeota archaeon]